MKTCGNQIVIGGLYANCTPPFFKGVLIGRSRNLKAYKHDASVLLLVKEDEEDA
jgi:hypothetical protein